MLVTERKSTLRFSTEDMSGPAGDASRAKEAGYRKLAQALCYDSVLEETVTSIRSGDGEKALLQAGIMVQLFGNSPKPLQRIDPLYLRGKAHLLLGSPEKAIQDFKAAINIAVTIPDGCLSSKLYGTIAGIQLENKHFGEALLSLDAALKELEQANTLSSYAGPEDVPILKQLLKFDNFNFRGLIYFQDKKLNLAESNWIAALNELTPEVRAKYPKAYLSILIVLSGFYMGQGKPNFALEYAEEDLFFRRANNLERGSDYYNSLEIAGQIFIELMNSSRLGEVIEAFERASTDLENNEDLRQQMKESARLYRLPYYSICARDFDKRGDSAEALKCHEQYVALAQQGSLVGAVEDGPHLFGAFVRVAKKHLQAGEIVEAKQIYAAYIRVSEPLVPRDPFTQAHAHGELAKLLGYIGNTAMAFAVGEKAIEFAEDTENVELKINTYMTVSLIYGWAKKKLQAEALAYKAISLAQSHPTSQEIRLNAYTTQIMLEIINSNYSGAYRIYERAKEELKDCNDIKLRFKLDFLGVRIQKMEIDVTVDNADFDYFKSRATLEGGLEPVLKYGATQSLDRNGTLSYACALFFMGDLDLISVRYDRDIKDDDMRERAAVERALSYYEQGCEVIKANGLNNNQVYVDGLEKRVTMCFWLGKDAEAELLEREIEILNAHLILQTDSFDALL